MGVSLGLGAVILLALGPSAWASVAGRTDWVARYNSRADNADVAVSVAASPDGSKVFVTGQSDGVGGFDYATVAYNALTGAKMWLKRYNGPGNGQDQPSSLAVSADGSKVFVTGQSLGPRTDYDYATVAYDASTGATLWVGRYNGPGNAQDAGVSVTANADGSKVFVTGQSVGPGPGGYDYVTVAYDASTGATLWVSRYNGPGNGQDSGRSVAVSPDGSQVYVTGLSIGTGTSFDYATVAYDASTGAKLWLKRYNGPGNGADSAASVAASPDGSQVFVTGGSVGVREDYATLAYATS